VAAADRAGRPGLGGGPDQGGGDDQLPVRGQRVGIGQGAGVGDRLQRQQRVDHLGRPVPAGRYPAATARRVGGVMVDHRDQLAQ
jgi:hypothetical protein